jgi:APA family basic amino acid/polyamine antiporter
VSTVESPRLERSIGLIGAMSLVMGSVIGSAVFLTTGIMAQRMPSPGLLLLAWIVGGGLALAGGLTCAELSAMYPQSGGWYVFLNEAYGPVWGFLFGWAGMLVILTGSLAAVAAGFAEYFSYFFPSLSTSRILFSLPMPWGMLNISAGQFVAAASIAILGAVNYVGVRMGNALQSVFTVIKIAGIAAIPILAFSFHPARPNFTLLTANVEHPLSSFGVTMIAVLWAYSGWDYLCFASGEIKDPNRNLPRALILGILTLILLYVAINVAYLFALRLDQMLGVERIAEKAVGALIGSAGAAVVAAGVMISCFGCNASCVIPVSRVCYALSEGGLFFKAPSSVHARYRTPHVAITGTCAWAALLTLTGTYEQLYTYVVFTALLFNVAGGMTIFKLRRIKPHLPRPYKTFGYPFVPAVFVLSTGVLLINTLFERPVESFSGLGLVALGLPAYWYWNRKRTPISSVAVPLEHRVEPRGEMP